MDHRSMAFAALSFFLLCTIGVRGANRCQEELDNQPSKSMPGAFTPQCTEKGHYQVIQHHGSSGNSWCVDPKTGVEIDGTRTGPTAVAECPTCITMLANSLEKILIGLYRPQCDQKGTFKQVQISASTGMAWCADPNTGDRLTTPQRWDGTLKCDARTKRHAGVGQCRQAYENALPQTMPGQFQAQCTEKGHYQVVQRHGSTGYSWCVHPVSGVKLEGSDAGPGTEPNCPTCLNLLGQSLEKILVGAYRPQCDTTGNFKQVQFSASTGMAWCADPSTGEKLTKPQRHDGTLKCDARTKRHAGVGGQCQQEMENSMPQTKPGEFRPKCTEKGHYEVVQTHGSTGYSWCVDPKSGVEIDGTRGGPGTQPKCPACVTLLAQALEKILVGAYRPQCDTKGNFKQVQVSASTGLAWCAHPVTGEKLTAPTRNDGTLKCDDWVSGVARRIRSSGNCKREVEHSSGGLGAFTPQCTEKGHYQLIQRHGSSGYSWCVDPTSGLTIEGTQAGPTGGQPQCPACVTLLSQSLEKILVGAYRPQCDQKGNFKSVQVSASTGLAWCADTATGTKLTQPQRHDGTLKC